MTGVLVNGQSNDTLSVFDRGLHYGDGVFETLKVVDGQVVLLEQHLQRLQMGCERLRIPQPPVEALVRDINTLAKAENKAVIKILVTRGAGGRGYRMPKSITSNRIVICYEFPHFPPDNYRQGVKIRLCDGRVSPNTALAGIKHLNRLEQVLARSEWQDESIAEGLMMDPQGYIIEGTMSNVFLVSRGRLLTPDLTSCGVAGIMRQQVLDTAQDLGINFDIRSVQIEDLLTANEIFLTNSVIDIWPVRVIEGIPNRRHGSIEYQIGPITEQIMGTLYRGCS
ncbi:MAG: aminodeoxychorismate lyase [Gammaproteobacteria bacterium]|nr:aminodeoxychorismate lyase [Gammaproteobacteria bacterium]